MQESTQINKQNEACNRKTETESIISLTSELIKFKSIEPENINASIKYCSDWLKQQGVQSSVILNNGLCSLVAEIGKEGPTILLNGHLDVVPGDPDQFIPVVRDGKIYGRGSFDMLGSVSAMMHAFVELSKKTLPVKVILVLVPDEETGGENGTGFLVEQGILGDFVICGETTNLDISVQSKGILQISLELQGVSSHGSRPWLGENAILKAFNAYKTIEQLDLFKESSPLFERPSLNLARIEGGGAINQVPDHCRMYLDIRYLPEQNPDEILQQIRNAIGSEIKVLAKGEPTKTNPLNEYVVNLKNSAENILGHRVRIFGQDGSADTRFYSMGGIPAVEFGPKGANHHGKDEYVFIDSLINFKKILIDYVMSN